MDFAKPNCSQRLQQQQQQHPKVEMAAMRQVIGFNPITTDMRPKLHGGGGQECRQSPSSSSFPPPSWSSGRGSTSPRSALQGLLLSSSAMDPTPLISHGPAATGGQSTNNGGLSRSQYGIARSDQCPPGGESKNDTKGVILNGASNHSSCNSSMMMTHGALNPSTTSSITNGAAINHPIISKSSRMINGADQSLLLKSSEVTNGANRVINGVNQPLLPKSSEVTNGASGVINGANHPITSSSCGVNNRNGANHGTILSNHKIQVQMEGSNYDHSITSNINSHSTATARSSCNSSHGFQETATRQATTALKGHNPTMSSDDQSISRSDRISSKPNGGKESCMITAAFNHPKLREIKECHQYAGMMKLGLQVLHRSMRAAGGFNSEGMAPESAAEIKSETRAPPYPVYKSNNTNCSGRSSASSSKRGSGRSLFVLVSSSDDYSNGDDCYYNYHDHDQVDYFSNHIISPSLSMDFLKRCHLCRRHLAPGYDIFMYNGDKAFCSVECRYQQIVTDERREKCPPLIMRASSNIPITTVATLYSHPSTTKPRHYNQRNLLSNNTMAVA